MGNNSDGLSTDNNYYFPRLMVRYEDLLFHAENVTTAICECVGGEIVSTKSSKSNNNKSTEKKKSDSGNKNNNKNNNKNGNFIYRLSSAKDDGSEKAKLVHGEDLTGFIDAIIKYGNNDHRYDGFTTQDTEFSKEYLDRNLMNF